MSGSDGTRIDEVLGEAARSGAVPGLVAIAIDRDGVVYEGAAGSLTAGGGRPAGPETMFRIASMTKALTSVAALQLVDEGRLELEQPVASVLPAYGELQVLDGFDGDAPRLRPPARQATIRQLLTHTAGQGYFFLNAELKRYHELTGLDTVLAGTRAIFAAPLVDDPGARWEYGINTDWLGLVVEAVTGRGLDVVLRERIFAPLGMGDATFAPSAEQRRRLMAVHARTPDGGLAVTDVDFPAGPEYWAGGHGVYATARDYARFLHALLNGGEGLLRPQTVDLMFTPQLGELALPEVIRSAAPELTNDVPSLPVAQSWGLGLHLYLEDLPGMRRAGSGDWAGIFNSYYWVDRATGIAAALFTQVLPFFDAQVIGTLQAFEQALYAEVGAASPA